MSISINYKITLNQKNSINRVFFIDEKFNILSLKKHIPSSEYSFISDLMKAKDLKKSILEFDLSSKKKLILVSLKKNISESQVENLGAKFFDLFKNNKIGQYEVVSNTLSSKQNILIGHFFHGLNLKSYKFEKYKTKKNKNNFNIIITGKNKPSLRDQIKFKAIEEGTFYTRDLVSEPGNILHPDEYSKRINSLRKFGLKVKIYDEKQLMKIKQL